MRHKAASHFSASSKSHEGARVGVAALRAGSSTELRRRVFYGGDSGLYLAAGNLPRVGGGWAARAGRRIRLANVGSRPRVHDSVLAAAAGADDCEGIDLLLSRRSARTPLVIRTASEARSKVAGTAEDLPVHSLSLQSSIGPTALAWSATAVLPRSNLCELFAVRIRLYGKRKG